MVNPTTLLRSLVIYAICVPVALVLGYVLATPVDRATFGMVGAVLVVLALPLLLRFHHPMMLLGWNSTMIVFFLPGSPGVWLPLVALSLLISIVRRTIDRDYRFISVPSLTWPLVLIGVVILATAEARGGIQFRSMGGDFYGGRNYVLALAAIAGYFALASLRIPPERAHLYTAFFFLGGLTTIVGDILYFQAPSLYFLYWFFPPNMGLYGGGEDILRGSIARFSGLNNACLVFGYYMLAKYGIRGIFSAHKPWRLALFSFVTAASLLGGFRSKLLALVLVFALQFYMEGMHRTSLLPVLLFAVILTSVAVFPFVQRLPFSIQRTLSFLPIRVDPVARLDAEASTEWRLRLWEAVLPQVGEYLWLGKGYALTEGDFDFSVKNLFGTMQAMSEDQSWGAISGNYHNGPLSVTIPFGIWGDAAFLWFLASGIRLVYRNYRYGAPHLEIVNKFIFALFMVKVFIFFVIFGGFYGDMQIFAGYLGLSVSLNGGMCHPAPEPSRTAASDSASDAIRTELQPAFPRPRLHG